jgi:predicted  nucleic acid-binding Zn-ribbon protein
MQQKEKIKNECSKLFPKSKEKKECIADRDIELEELLNLINHLNKELDDLLQHLNNIKTENIKNKSDINNLKQQIKEIKSGLNQEYMLFSKCQNLKYISVKKTQTKKRAKSLTFNKSNKSLKLIKTV